MSVQDLFPSPPWRNKYAMEILQGEMPQLKEDWKRRLFLFETLIEEFYRVTILPIFLRLRLANAHSTHLIRILQQMELQCKYKTLVYNRQMI